MAARDRDGGTERTSDGRPHRILCRYRPSPIEWVRRGPTAERHKVIDGHRPNAIAGLMTPMDEGSPAEAEARRAGEMLAGIAAVVREIATGNLTVPDVMNGIATRAQALTGAAGGLIEMVEGQERVCRAASGAAAGNVGLRSPRGGGLSGLAVESGEALVSDDAETDDRMDRVACRRAGVRSMVVAPLHDGQQVIGVLEVVSGEPRAFGECDVSTLQLLAASLSGVIQRQQAEEAAQ